MSDKKYTYSENDDVEHIMILADNWLHTWDVLGEGANPEPEKARQEAYRNLKKAVEELSEKARSNNDVIKAEPENPKPLFNGWYCPHCESGVDPTEVTFSEHHQVCGTYIGDTEPPKLAKPDQEPLCVSCKAIGAAYVIGKESPQQKQLNDDEIKQLAITHGGLNDCFYEGDFSYLEFARAIEKSHGIGAL